MGVEQQVVADRRNPLGGADHQLRDSGGDVDFSGRPDHWHALDAGDHRAQGWAPYHWFLFSNPFCFVAAIVLYISALAEGNRTPFDLPEAESELVAGFATEYSGMRYLLFFFAEWGNMFIAGALITTLYLGGWQTPRVSSNALVTNVLQLVTFNVKVLFLVFTSMWVRGTLPRVRIDQMMSLCWKFFVPIAFINMIGTAVWVAVWPDGNRVGGYVMFALGVAITVLFVQRVMYYLKRSRIGNLLCIRRI